MNLQAAVALALGITIWTVLTGLGLWLQKMRTRPGEEYAHKFTDHDPCELHACSGCGCFEGTLPASCPGVRVPHRVQGLIYRGVVDFEDGRWVAARGNSGNRPPWYDYLFFDHSAHGRAISPGDGPWDCDCACRGTPSQGDCARAGCGFCRSADER